MPWSMKTERGVVQLASSELRVAQIATKLKISPEAVIKIGRRLGIRLPPLELKQNGRRKTK
jgi:DNA-binding CsgD family transcriptional regulator